jgi:hypothetical protein
MRFDFRRAVTSVTSSQGVVCAGESRAEFRSVPVGPLPLPCVWRRALGVTLIHPRIGSVAFFKNPSYFIRQKSTRSLRSASFAAACAFWLTACSMEKARHARDSLAAGGFSYPKSAYRMCPLLLDAGWWAYMHCSSEANEGNGMRSFLFAALIFFLALRYSFHFRFVIPP